MIDYLMWPWFERMEMMDLKQYVFIFLHLISANALEKEKSCYYGMMTKSDMLPFGLKDYFLD